MATSLSTLEYFLDCLSLVPDLSYRKMFGEYGIYSGEKMFALACDNMLFFKTFPETLHHFADTETRAYPGSKNTAMANPEWLEDRAHLAQLALLTIAHISPKKKKL